MQISYQWLLSWVHPSWTLPTFVEKLTHAGIEVESFEPIDKDTRIHFKITPNRGDCLSVRGLAREVGVLSKMKVNEPAIPAVPVTGTAKRAVSVAPETGAYYMGRLIEGIHPQATVSSDILYRLKMSGIQSTHPIVDILNYVMIELGQPMHVFDAIRLTGALEVRYAMSTDTLTLLNDTVLKDMASDTLLIADEKGPVALAGIMGGKPSLVQNNTTQLWLESAWFEPLGVAKTARFYGLHTEGATRFERGVDIALAEQALERATALILEIAGGTAGALMKAGVLPPAIKPIILRKMRIMDVLGMTVSANVIEDTLTRLGARFEVMPEGWRVRAPSYRSDLTTEIDWVEEIGRVVGYDLLPVQPMQAALRARPISESEVPANRFLRCLVDRGYQEAITYSFVSDALQAWADPTTTALSLQNPLSESLKCMRTQVWPSLVEAWQYNRDRQQPFMRLFELGERYHPNGTQETVIAGVVAGTWGEWSEPKRPIDFFDIKGDVEALLALWQQPVTFGHSMHPALHPGQSANIQMNGKIMGVLGALHPDILKKLGLTEPVLIFELTTEALKAPITTVQPVSRFPFTRRDLALLVPVACSAEAILQTIRSVSPWVHSCGIFDVYQGRGIAPGKKSLGVSVVIQDVHQTLSLEAVDTCMMAVMKCLTEEHAAEQRG